MSKVVDERIVEMKFDNRNFESNVGKSMSTLDRLKNALKFKGVSNGIEDLSKSINKVNFSGMQDGIETVNARFSSMQVVAMTALSNITTAAMSAGTKLASALTITPIISGFHEYETQINAIQTILANTQSKGTTLTDVNRALDELNKYADQTIYNFTEMTRNIGTFTAAGVDLDKSVTSIKGIANLAAVSGSTSAQASQAMYQLSQALATGRVSLMDWNSVVNAGMGGEVFQTALKRTAENMGTNVDALIEKYGSFRDSLTEGQWLTTDVLTETLTQLSGAYNEADLLAKGYTKEQAQQILQLAQTAVDAATKVKTFTQLFDTLGEALQSGWTKSWEIILGDFNEAQSMFTRISETLGDAINSSADARNAVLMEGLSSGWKQFLNEGINDEEAFINTVKSVANEHGVAVDKMLKDGTTFEETLKSGWLNSDMLTESVTKYADSLSKMSAEERTAAGYTGEQVEELKKFADQLKTNSSLADEFTNKMKMASGRENVIEGLWNIFSELARIIGVVRDAFREIFPPITGDQLYAFTENFKNFTETLTLSDTAIGNLKSTFKGLFAVLDIVAMAFSTIFDVLGSFLGVAGQAGEGFLGLTGSLGDFLVGLRDTVKESGAFAAVGEFLKGVLDGVSSLIESVTGKITGFSDVFSAIGDAISRVAGIIWNAISKAFSWITENVSIGGVFAGLGAVGGLSTAKSFANFVGTITDSIGLLTGEGSFIGDVKENITDLLDGVHGALESFTTGIKATTLISIAVAIGILALSLGKLSEIDSGTVVQSLIAMGTMFTMLGVAFRSITKSLDMFESRGIVKSGIALIAMATALYIFASAMQKVSELEPEGIAKGLVGLGFGLAGLVTALKFLDKSKVSLKTSVAMIALAKACEMLADALEKFSGFSWDEISRGLTAMGGALGELVIALGVLSKVGGGGSLLGSVGILIAVQSLGTLAESLDQFSKFSWEEIGRGLAAMGGALGELVIALGVLSKVGGFGSILGGTAILIAAQSLDEISENLKRLGSMSWEEIGRGLAAMGGALFEVAGISGALGKIAGFSGIIGSGSILIVIQGLGKLADAFQRLGSMSWEEIGRGLAAMGGALAETGLAAGLTGLSGLSGILGSASILIVIQGLEQLANGLQQFGSMNWDEIGRGLTAMGGALAILGGASFLTGLGGLASVIGSGSLLLATQGLGDLADALQKFGSMNWDEIGRGLTAMGAALGETALGGLLNTFSGFGAGAIAEMAAPLGQLADSVKKWTTVEVPDGFGEKLGQIGKGVQAFNFSGWGADAIASMGSSLGDLADSVKKWADVTVPEGLGDQLKTLAPGIEAFNFSGWGGEAIATVAEPLGLLADSVKKWSSVTIPDGMEEKLSGLGRGVKSFNFSGWGASDMAEVVEPLGNLAGAVNKWSNITIPENMEEILSGLARGIKSFELGLFEDVNVDAFISPLNTLAEVLPKYNGISISTTIGDGIESLGKGVKSLSDKDPGDLTNLCDAIDDLVDSAQTIINANFSGAASALSSFADAVNAVNISGDNFVNLGTNLVASFVDSLNSGVGQVQVAAQNLAQAAVTSFTSAVSGSAMIASTAGLALSTGLAMGIQAGSGHVVSSMQSILIQIAQTISSTYSTFQTGGTTLVKRIATGISTGKSFVISSIRSCLSSASSVIKSYYGTFYSSGAYLSQGMANGIASRAASAAAQAARMASNAAAAARRASQEHSPSKVFHKIGSYMGEGMVNGLKEYQPISKKAGADLAETAADGLSRAISRVSDVLDSDMDVNPVITPVLDLSDVQNGASVLNSILATSVPVNILGEVGSINRGMNARNQNTSTFDDVVYSIDRLRRDLADLPRNIYSVGDITYDDGTTIANAVESLIRATRIERRS